MKPGEIVAGSAMFSAWLALAAATTHLDGRELVQAGSKLDQAIAELQRARAALPPVGL